MRVGTGVGLSFFALKARAAGGGPSPYDVSAQALFARMTVQPDTARKTLINSMIVGLKSDGVWDRLDGLHMYAAHTAQAAGLNWIADKYQATPVNSPIFTADRGYQGDGSSAYIDCNYVIDGLGEKRFQLNDASISGFVNLSGVSGNRGIIGANNSFTYLNPRNSGQNPLSRINAGVGTITTTIVPDRLGGFTSSRVGANETNLYRNGSKIYTDTSVSRGDAVSGAYSMLSLLYATSSFSSDRVACVAWGGGLTDAQAAALHARILDYVTAIGAQ